MEQRTDDSMPSVCDGSRIFAGKGAIDLYSIKYPIMYLIQVQAKDLPEDFPKDLVRWIP